MTRDRSNEVPRWASTVLALPLLLGVAGFIGLLLAVFAASGHWIMFWIVAAVEAYAVLASLSAARYYSRKRKAEGR